MVSKVAVIALVAVIAVPILLGYALNLTETTETDYKVSGDPVNVTPLLNNSVDYTYIQANAYQLNTDFKVTDHSTYPAYSKTTTAKTSLKGNIAYTTGTNIISSGALISNYDALSYIASYTMSSGYITLTYKTSDNVTHTVNYFHSFIHDYSTGTSYISYYTSDAATSYTAESNVVQILGFAKTGSYNGMMYVFYDYPGESVYIDLAGGFRTASNFTNNDALIELPDYTKSYTLTVNLDSITDSNYTFVIGNYGYMAGGFKKTTVGGDVSWQAFISNSGWFDIYYDPNRSDNTYQVYLESNIDHTIGTNDYYNTHTEIRYVGGWPNLIGEANYYNKYSYDSTLVLPSSTPGFSYIAIESYTTGVFYTPKVRVDSANFRGTELQVIGDSTYAPADFKSNPATTITSINKYGSSLTFGGTTYTVSKEGKITIDGHAVPVKDLVFSSVPNAGGTYDNKIGNTLISTSAAPSTITFGGKWSASVSTDSMESYTYTHTEWNAGKFAWDGINQNFLIVGLITCLGVFIALGIYAKKKGSGGLIPLMIAVGCAAMVFFVML